MTEKLLTPAQVAELLQVTERSVYRWLDAKELPGHKLGRVWRIKEEDLQTFLKERSNQAQQ